MLAASDGALIPNRVAGFLDLLRCPASGSGLRLEGETLASRTGRLRYRIDRGIPLFAEQCCSSEGRSQQAHYDAIAPAYTANLEYPHTEAYGAALHAALLDIVDPSGLAAVAELCCGGGEAFDLLGAGIGRGVGVDVSPAMLRVAAARHAGQQYLFVQGDATRLPLASDSFDSVFMLGGIHHINDRRRLFAEIARILRPGGRFYFREPVSDFWLWRALRRVVYRLSPLLDEATEHPLRHEETVTALAAAGLRPVQWRTVGFFGFCLFMNADVLVFNRLFRFIPGIRAVARAAFRCDEALLALPGLRNAGLQVIGAAERA